MEQDEAIVHIDGASRGNPGAAAYAVVIRRPGGEVVEESASIGTETNNVAEYTGLVKALEKARSLGLKKLHIHSDSELLVKQMNGEYRVKNADLQSLFAEAKELQRQFEHVRLTHVRREQNKRADELCNIVLDGEKPKKSVASSSNKSSQQKAQGLVSDGRVREDCLECLHSARACWSRGEALPSPEMLWDQLWSILEEGGVLRKG